MIPPLSPCRFPFHLAVSAALLLLGACSVAFDVPLSADRPAAWQDDLVGYWKVEFEDEWGEKNAALSEFRKLEDGAFQLNLLAEGLTSLTLRFASHGDRDYAVYDLGSLMEFKPGEPKPDLVQFASAKGTYGIKLLRRDGEEIIAYDMLRDAVERDLGSRPLEDVAQEGCGIERSSPDPAQSPDGEAIVYSDFTCLVRIGDEAALRAYLDARGDALFDLRKPTRFTRLF